ncbi:heme lyase NrfEFG subunit NrfF [Providencia rettgeri]|nr:heme lyase NrfEFG subunit NrfF [Providencia rettgeri]ELQ1456752.1 heme lyase NrfEFG subunit NrfF [Providencia rettgeri]ELR5169475.1 heme lyase NrfEFG subunit NrfF [Providencia rettgeri]ELR5188081.1 heme lyase NrfEFG subunit NrfF [Providencia rettgeri]EMB0750791.1 heme lyase NrfEFG subunit NrfF [Providencia rettgeri]
MNKALVTFIFLFASFMAKAQIVDVWQFNSQEEQDYSLQIASSLRCPQCQNQNLLESNAPTAVSMRHQVFKMVAEGKNKSQIQQYMTDRYGEFVLYNPPLTLGTALLWGLPIIALAGILSLTFYLTLRQKYHYRHDSAEVTQTTKQLLVSVTDESPSQQKRNTVFIIVLFFAIIGYFFIPRFELTYREYLRISDPLLSFTPLQQEQNDLLRLQNDIRQSPENSELWATLGEYYLYQNSYDNALIAYYRALKYGDENAQIYSAIATVLYYQAGQHLTPDAHAVINKALALDNNEVTALMLVASDAFMNANYEQAIDIWQKLLDSNSSRINRSQLIEAIHMAKIMGNKK